MADSNFPARLMKYLFFLLLLVSTTLRAQDNYEIQVYGSELIKPHQTMLELHSNFTINGFKTMSPDGLMPTQHVEHETIEITHGFTPWLEVGVYFFNSLGSEGRTAYVGSHIRPRVSAPLDWHWPVGVSLSGEFGFQKRAFAPNSETLEIRPIVDKQFGPWYLALNPTLVKTFRGPDQDRLIFSPNIKGSYEFNKVMALGLEYYGSLGQIGQFDTFVKQQQQLFLVTDLNLAPNWEFNLGAGYGATTATERLIVKMILGHTIGRGTHAARPVPVPKPE